MDFSLSAKAQNDNALPFLQVDFLLWFAPCKSLGSLLQRLKMTKSAVIASRFHKNGVAIQISLEFCPKFKAKIKKDEMLWNSKSNFTKRCSQTLARPALYRHSFHRDLDLAIQSLLGGVCKGLNSLLLWAFVRKRKIYALKVQICTLNSWILRYAQYDKIYKYNKVQQGKNLGLCLNFTQKMLNLSKIHKKFIIIRLLKNS